MHFKRITILRTHLVYLEKNWIYDIDGKKITNSAKYWNFAIFKKKIIFNDVLDNGNECSGILLFSIKIARIPFVIKDILTLSIKLEWLTQ